MSEDLGPAPLIAADFLARFYHEQPSDEAAAADAAGALTEAERARVVDAFAILLATEHPPEVLRDFVRRHANRYAVDDASARAFLERVPEHLSGAPGHSPPS